jgi:hypothetical protein
MWSDEVTDVTVKQKGNKLLVGEPPWLNSAKLAEFSFALDRCNFVKKWNKLNPIAYPSSP